jgi:hypothetical protein
MYILKGGRYGRTSTRAAAMERMREMAIEKRGLDPAHLRAVQAHIRDMGLDHAPTLASGRTDGQARVKGEVFNLIDEHTNGHGDRVLEAERKTSSGLVEKIHIREAQAGPSTRVIAEISGA